MGLGCAGSDPPLSCVILTPRTDFPACAPLLPRNGRIQGPAGGFRSGNFPGSRWMGKLALDGHRWGFLREELLEPLGDLFPDDLPHEIPELVRKDTPGHSTPQLSPAARRMIAGLLDESLPPT